MTISACKVIATRLFVLIHLRIERRDMGFDREHVLRERKRLKEEERAFDRARYLARIQSRVDSGMASKQDANLLAALIDLVKQHGSVCAAAASVGLRDQMVRYYLEGKTTYASPKLYEAVGMSGGDRTKQASNKAEWERYVRQVEARTAEIRATKDMAPPRHLRVTVKRAKHPRFDT
jgi:hypothetical protein